METAAGLLGLVQAVISYGLRRALANRKRLVAAADDFRGAFLACKLELETSGADPYEIIRPHFERQRLAVEIFKPYLKASQQSKFTSDWNAYYSFPGHAPQPFLEKYFAAGSVSKSGNERKKAVRRIEKLMSYAPIY